MVRRNRVPYRVRVEVPSREVGGRTRCLQCGVLMPRGADRPYCVDDSPYVLRLREAMAVARR